MDFNKEILLGSKLISETSPAYIIAEAGVNHNGDIKIAKKLIDIAAEAKADAVKFQAFKTENLILEGVTKANYQIKNTGEQESQFQMLKKLELSTDQNKELLAYCKEKGIDFLTTPFDEESLDSLDSLNLIGYKIASTDLTNLPFLEKIANKNKPIILSTGMSYFSEVELALDVIYKFNKDVALLQCSANYPIADADANLNVITTYKNAFNMLIGYSDHSVGIGAAPYAVPMGAKIIEKHFTLDKSEAGPDHKASLDPQELIDFVSQIRKVEEYMGTAIKFPSKNEQTNRKALQKNLVAAMSIKIGDIFTKENLIARRTGGKGISPLYYREIIGKPSKANYTINEIINE
jgi:N-acetylneuraminate synthase